jgi:hypothetical protein
MIRIPLSALQKKFICGEIPPRDKDKSFKRPLQFEIEFKTIYLAICSESAASFPFRLQFERGIQCSDLGVLLVAPG